MATKLLKLPAVLTRVAISRSKLYAGVKEGTFPAPVSLGARATLIQASRNPSAKSSAQEGA
ncbi:AlpA family phage regulatory protein [Massilia cavernae]|uniref:AlpA family phage regulatory protein n=2 Tax=Massilia cavernae TaxID=2320864 RepID=A0A418Y7I8_9BURK|nr:AlpA family phage regulatory protein [Massilia cavernae]